MNSHNYQSAMTVTGIQSIQPDYNPSAAFGQLIELEGAANQVIEKLKELEKRLNKALRPPTPASCPPPANIRSVDTSEIACQISTVRTLLMAAVNNTVNLIECIDL